MRARSAVLLLAMTPGLGGCLMPLSYRELPDITGQVVRGGEPIANAPVRTVASLEEDGAPSPRARRAEARTGPDGSFRLAPRDGHEWVVVAGTMDRLSRWALQVFVDGRWVDGFTSSGLGDSRPLYARCDFAEPPARREVEGGRGSGTGVCALSTMNSSDSDPRTKGASE